MTLALVPLCLAGLAAQAMAQTTVAKTFGFTPTSDCTMTVVTTTGAPLPPYGWKPTWTFTKYTRTDTSIELIDCAGCRKLVTATLLIDFYYPDAPRHLSTTVTAVEPTTVVDFRCGSPLLPFINPLAPPLPTPGLDVPPPGLENLPSGFPTAVPILIPRDDPEGLLLPQKPPIFGTPPIPILVSPEITAPPLPEPILAVDPPVAEPDQPAPDNLLDPAPNPDIFQSPPFWAGPPEALAEPVLEEIGLPALPIVKRGRKRSLCTKLLLHAPELTFGPTKTVWTETETFTESIDCSGCPNLVESVLPLGVPPVAIFDVTTTAEGASTTTVLACAETPRVAPSESSTTFAEPTGSAAS